MQLRCDRFAMPAFRMESLEGSETAVRQQRVYCIIAGTVSPLRRSLQIEYALSVTAIGAVRYTATEDWSFLDSPHHDRSNTGHRWRRRRRQSLGRGLSPQHSAHHVPHRPSALHDGDYGAVYCGRHIPRRTGQHSCRHWNPNAVADERNLNPGEVKVGPA
jgi:hypothetical protein